VVGLQCRWAGKRDKKTLLTRWPARHCHDSIVIVVVVVLVVVVGVVVVVVVLVTVDRKTLLMT